MVTHVSRVEHLHGQFAPVASVGVELLRVKFVVQQTAFATHQMRVEIVGLQAVDNRGRLPDGAVCKPQDCHARCVVFVGLEDVTG